MTTREELLNRRIGRMEALASDLAGLPASHQPTELELIRARELYATLARAFDVVIKAGDPGEPEAKPGKAGKK